MDTNLQPPSWGWITAVLVSTVVILPIASGVMMPLEKLLNPRRLHRLPPWSRWLLVIPAAFASGFAAEIVPRVLFALLEIIVNHELLFRPGFDILIWQLWAPLFFVAGGVQMAPRLKFSTFLVVGGLKIAVATANSVRDLRFVHAGGPWSAPDPTTASPLWWASSYTPCASALSLPLAGSWQRKPWRNGLDIRRRSSRFKTSSSGSPLFAAASELSRGVEDGRDKEEIRKR